MHHNVIISGYPKSGNTWLTRLTAELIGCPVAGFWSQPDRKDFAIEGLQRDSDYRCFKSHHTYPALVDSCRVFGNGSEKVIYLVRDPRDVAISATFFFKRLRGKRTLRLLGLSRLHDEITLRLKLIRYCKIVASGGDLPWMNVPWAEHAESYLEKDILFIKYENLLTQPVTECKRVVRYLGINRADRDIEEAVRLQSFSHKKADILEKKSFREADFLRAGKSGQWRDVLSEEQKMIITDSCGDIMQKLDYL